MSESTPPNSPASTSDAETPPEDQADNSSAQPDSQPKPDDLPEEYELTPELVEEEAIRADFVLRWAAVLLAVMLGCTRIADSEVLVHVKSGQHLVSHGIIPDGTDPFAYTTEGRVWRNQSWLFDLMLAGVYGVGGAIGLSLFKALIAGLTIWCIVGISRPNTPTWWTAIVAVLGTVALIPYLTATPEIMTILGCAVLLRMFHTWRFQTPPSLNWKLAVLFLVWSNTDPRMYLGLLLLVVLAAGESLRSTPRDGAPIIPAKALWPTVGVVCLVSLVNPFGWHSWVSAWEVHGVFDPAMRAYFADSFQLNDLHSFPVWSAAFWERLTVPFICALVLAGLALSSIYLNFGKWIAGDILVVLVFGGLAALTLREFAPAIIVMCVVTSLYCQDWYRESFSQEYTVNQGEVLFSRGGRALTVISFVAVAWLGMRGRLYQEYPASMGFGFENHLNVSLTDLESTLADSYDVRPFNFTIGQGDTLIWADQQVFIDSRLGLFAGSKDSLDDLTRTDLIALHSRTRQAMRYTDDPEKNLEHRSLWKEVFNRFKITHALPRIAGRAPDYTTYNDLLVNPEFQLIILTPSVAAYYRTDLDDGEYGQYLADHGLDFITQAFRQEVAAEETIERNFFPQSESAYVSYLTSDRKQIPPTLFLAQHYLQHIAQVMQGRYQIDFRNQLAFCYLAIRHANLGLAENPDSAFAFQLLGQAYYNLALIEQDFAQINGVRYDPTFRMMQSHLAFHQSLIGEPDDIAVTELLMRIAQSRNKPESMLRMARRLVELLEAPGEQIADEEQTIKQTQTMIEQLEAQLNPFYERVTSELEKGTDPLQIVTLLSNPCPYTALEIIDKNSDSIPQDSQIDLLRGILAIETGNAEEAYTTLLKLEPFFSQVGLVDGYRYATYAALGHADYPNALDLKESETEMLQRLRAAQVLLPTAPLADDPEIYNRSRYERWFYWLNDDQETIVRKLWEQAIILLEEGRNSDAEELLKRAFEIAPNSNFRPMLFAYHTCVSSELIDPMPPVERIPVTGDMFAEDREEPQK